MRKCILLLTTTGAILACGAIAASAQAPVAQTPSTQQSPTTPPTSGGPVTQKVRDRMLQGLQDSVQGGEDENSDDPNSCYRYHGAMMGMMGRGMMGRGLMMRLVFSLMDTDNDGTLSLPEFQAVSERIFKAMDTDKDGTVSLEEMQDFIRGARGPASQK